MPKIKDKRSQDDREWQAVHTMRHAASQLPPTLKHRPALTFGILGTVYGVSPAGEVKYFDYDWAGALKFAGVCDDNLELLDGLDLRVSATKRDVILPGYTMWYPERKVARGDKAWWVLREA